MGDPVLEEGLRVRECGRARAYDQGPGHRGSTGEGGQAGERWERDRATSVTFEGCQGREPLLDGRCAEDTGYRERQRACGRVLTGCWESGGLEMEPLRREFSWR